MRLDAYNGKATAWTRIGPAWVTMDMSKLQDLLCPHLGPDGRCTAYEVRPMICRLWGVTRSMACPWGCIPDRWLSDGEAMELLKLTEERCLSAIKRK